VKCRPFTPAEDRQIAEWIVEGVTQDEIARRLGRKRQSVSWRRKYLKLAPRYVLWTPEDVVKLSEGVAAGVFAGQLASALCRGKDEVVRKAKKLRLQPPMSWPEWINGVKTVRIKLCAACGVSKTEDQFSAFMLQKDPAFRYCLECDECPTDKYVPPPIYVPDDDTPLGAWVCR